MREHVVRFGDEANEYHFDRRPWPTHVRAVCHLFGRGYDEDDNYYVLTQGGTDGTARVLRRLPQLAAASEGAPPVCLRLAADLARERLSALRDATAYQVMERLQSLLELIRGDVVMSNIVIEENGMQCVLAASGLAAATDVRHVELAMACLCELFQIEAAQAWLEEHQEEELHPALFRRLFAAIFRAEFARPSKGGLAMGDEDTDDDAAEELMKRWLSVTLRARGLEGPLVSCRLIAKGRSLTVGLAVLEALIAPPQPTSAAAHAEALTGMNTFIQHMKQLEVHTAAEFNKYDRVENAVRKDGATEMTERTFSIRGWLMLAGMPCPVNAVPPAMDNVKMNELCEPVVASQPLSDKFGQLCFVFKQMRGASRAPRVEGSCEVFLRGGLRCTFPLRGMWPIVGPCSVAEARTPIVIATRVELPPPPPAPSAPPLGVDGHPAQDCPVCLGPLSRSSNFVLPCGHHFHSMCCGMALQVSAACPSCRTEVQDSTYESLASQLQTDPTVNGDLASEVLVSLRSRAREGRDASSGISEEATIDAMRSAVRRGDANKVPSIAALLGRGAGAQARSLQPPAVRVAAVAALRSRCSDS
ncbi:unnamed protein product [Prorocentrum cordatum]|uniref:RING-type domain-containing protein n=1 Tax=Prorocentrum cordatum TaxID=2364126 RepID=A0ABN9TGS8_9DINO|nr:unnamed protein product [Polarella glacialis]